MRVEFDRSATSETEIRRVLAEMGVRPRAPAPTAVPAATAGHAHDHATGAHDHGSGEARHSHAHGGVFGANPELIFALICSALLGAGFAGDGWKKGAFPSGVDRRAQVKDEPAGLVKIPTDARNNTGLACATLFDASREAALAVRGPTILK